MINSIKPDNIDCLFIHVPRMLAHNDSESEFFVNVVAMGVFSMSNELKKNGFTPQIINLGVEKALNIDFDIANYVKKHNIKLVGFSMHWYHQTYDTLIVAEKIKKINPDVHIFLGGYTSSALAEEILSKCPYIDSVIKGEGEKPIVEFVKRFKTDSSDFSGIPNIYWRGKTGGVNRNSEIWFANEAELNSYDFDGIEFIKNSDKYLKFSIHYTYNHSHPEKMDVEAYNTFICCLGRGCTGNCTWCGGGFEATKCITGRNKVVLRDVNIAAEEIIKLKTKYDYSSFYFCFDPYPNNQEYLVDLFNLLGKAFPKQIHIRFECFGLPTKEFIDAFSKNLDPRSEIILSPEFGNEQMRKKHKTFFYSNEKLMESIAYMVDLKIPLTIYFTELPNETKGSEIETKQLIDKIIAYSPKSIIHIFKQPIKDIEPYSPWALNPQKYDMPVMTPNLEYYIKRSKVFRDFT